MKISTYEVPESSFLSVDKDMALIVNKIFENNRLKKLLYYTRPDCLTNKQECPNLTDRQTAELFGKEIRLIPKIEVDEPLRNYIVINFDDFVPNATNPEFRDNMIYFNILCPYDLWHLKDYQLRPYTIAGEIDSMLNEKHLTGIGTLHFLSANRIALGDDLAGLVLAYAAIHGDEDKKWPLTPIEE